MPHGKHFLFGLTGMVQGRLGWAGQEMQAIGPRIEEIMSETQWLSNADFDTIHYVMRFGAEKMHVVDCRKRSRYHELEVASQESMTSLHKVFLDRVALRRFLSQELKRVLAIVQSKYGLPENAPLFEYLESQATGSEPTDGMESR